jgi:hypothetical protein
MNSFTSIQHTFKAHNVWHIVAEFYQANWLWNLWGFDLPLIIKNLSPEQITSRHAVGGQTLWAKTAGNRPL